MVDSVSKEKLTKRQLEILTFIKKYIIDNGYSPSIREICSGCNLSSSATVHAHITTLTNKGYINKSNNKFRTIEIIDDEKIYNIPLIKENDIFNNIKSEEYVKLSNRIFNINKNSYVLLITDPLNKYYNNYIIFNKNNKYDENDLVISINNNELIIQKYNSNLNVYGEVVSIINNIK